MTLAVEEHQPTIKRKTDGYSDCKQQFLINWFGESDRVFYHLQQQSHSTKNCGLQSEYPSGFSFNGLCFSTAKVILTHNLSDFIVESDCDLLHERGF